MTRHEGSEQALRLNWRTPVAVAMMSCALAACSSGNSTVKQAAQVADSTQDKGDAAMLSLAQKVAAEGDHNAAIPLYREAHRQDSSAVAPLTGLGESLLAIGQLGEAEEVLRRAVERDKRNPEALHLLGMTYLQLGQPTLAEENFRLATAYGAGARAWSSLGVALDAQGQHAAALDAFEEATSLSDAPTIRTNLALSYALHNEPEKAVTVLEKVVQEPSSGPEQRQNLVLAYVFAGRTADAMEFASIDLDQASATSTVAYFNRLRTMPMTQRVQALVYAGSGQKTDRSSDGYFKITGNEELKKMAVARLLAPEPEPEPKPEPAPMPEPEPELPGVPPLSDGEGWAVQIAAYRTQEELIRGWELLSSEYADILKGLEPRRSEVDFGDRRVDPKGFFYRLNAGPLKTYEEAKDICDALADRGAACWIRPPEPTEGRLPRVGGPMPEK